MSEAIAFQVIRSALALFCLLLAWMMWKRCALDRFRQDLFKIRDDLFDLAARNEDGLAFNSPAYLHLRCLINGMIRFGHTLTLGRIMSLQFFSKFFTDRPFAKEGKSRFEEELGKVQSEDLRLRLRVTQVRVVFSLFKFISSSHPLLFPFAVAMVFARYCVSTASIMKRVEWVMKRPTGKVISAEAELFAKDSGELTLAAA